MTQVSVEQLLRQPPPRRAVEWVERTTGHRVLGVRALYGGVSHATHAVDLDGSRGPKTLVLRRWVRPDDAKADPDYTAQHEAATLTLLESANASAPRLVSVDADGSACDVPAVLQTFVPGASPLHQVQNLTNFATGLAAAIVPVHSLRTTPARDLALPYKRYYEVDRIGVPRWSRRPQMWLRALAIAGLPEPAGDRCLIHRDYHQGNTRWEDDRLTGIIDWDRASWGSPSVDLARMRQNLVTQFGFDVSDGFTAAYFNLSHRSMADLHYWDVVDSLDTVPDMREPSDSSVWERFEEHVSRAVRAFDSCSESSRSCG